MGTVSTQAWNRRPVILIPIYRMDPKQNFEPVSRTLPFALTPTRDLVEEALWVSVIHTLPCNQLTHPLHQTPPQV